LNDEQERTINRPSVVLPLSQRTIKTKLQIPFMEPKNGIQTRDCRFYYHAVPFY